MEYTMETRHDPVDKTLWPDTPQTVNAYYMPQDNSINLLAGILMPPFYDPEASEEENLGSIGTVIAHEITHAVDHGRGFLPYYNEPEGSADPSGLKSIIYA